MFAKRVMIGSSDKRYPGWLSTNEGLLDVTKKSDFARVWLSRPKSAFLAEHVWEHMTEKEAGEANANCYKYLKPGGYLRLAVPDGFHPDNSYIDQVRPGGTGIGAHDHKVLYNYKSLGKSLEKAGFNVRLLEYWDEGGKFHFTRWSSGDGYIMRSKENDPRNKNGSLNYTSLIVDAIKPLN